MYTANRFLTSNSPTTNAKYTSNLFYFEFDKKTFLQTFLLPNKTLTLLTDIWLVVRVPVLSEQITEVHPNVCTEGSDLTMEFFLAILLVPRARQVVMTAGSPSGMAATAKATAIWKFVYHLITCKTMFLNKSLILKILRNYLSHFQPF